MSNEDPAAYREVCRVAGCGAPAARWVRVIVAESSHSGRAENIALCRHHAAQQEQGELDFDEPGLIGPQQFIAGPS